MNPQNNYHTDYNLCLICYQSDNYYCLEEDKIKCVEISKEEIQNKTYYNLTNNCVKKYENQYNNCSTCYSSQCITCKPTHYLNRNKEYVERMPHCLIHDEDVNPAVYKKCDEDYHCINNDRIKCVYWPDMDRSIL